MATTGCSNGGKGDFFPQWFTVREKVSQQRLSREKNNCFDGEKRGVFTVVSR